MRGTLSTGSVNPFTFRMLGGYLENRQLDLNMGQLWELIEEDDNQSPNREIRGFCRAVHYRRPGGSTEQELIVDAQQYRSIAR